MRKPYVFATRWHAAAALAAATIATTAHAVSLLPVALEIPSGSLADALDLFGEQSGLQVVYDYSLIGDRIADGVAGTMPPREALERLLGETDLAWDFANDVTVVLKPAPRAEPPPSTPRHGSRRRGSDTRTALSELTVIGTPGSDWPNAVSSAAFGVDKPLVQTPRAVSIVSDDTIDLLGLSAVEDLVRVVPGVYTTTRWGIQGSIDVRNVPADTFFRGMKRVNLQGHARSALAAMETIEIVKGPPSPVYGMGKIGGYTNMVPRSVRAANGAYLEESQGFVQAVSGSYEKSELSFGIGGPLAREGGQGAGYYVYGLFEDSGSFVEQVPVSQRILQAAVSADDVIGGFRLEAGLNVQRSRTAGALIGRVTQGLVDDGRYIRGVPLVDLDANGNGRIGYLEMHTGSPVGGVASTGNQPLRQNFAWPRNPDGSLAPLGSVTVAGIPQSMYDYLVVHPEADPTGLLRAQGVGGPLPLSGAVPAGFALDPSTVGYGMLDARRAAAFERELEADLVTAYLDFVNDTNADFTIKNQLFYDSMHQYKVSDQPFSQVQDVYVLEDKLTVGRKLTPDGSAVGIGSVMSVNLRRTSSRGATSSGDYASHRGDAMSAQPASDPRWTFASALDNEFILDDGMPWTGRYATESWELGIGALFDFALPAEIALNVGARLDYSRAENTDYAGTVSFAFADPYAVRAENESAHGRTTSSSWSVSLSRRFSLNVHPYFTLAQSGVSLDENNNKYDNRVIELGHVGRARLAEIGVKAGLLEDRLFFSSAFYEQRRDDVGLDDAPQLLNAHVSATATRGFEAEMKWALSPALFLSLYGVRQETRYSPNVGATLMVDARALGFRDVVDAAGNVVYPAEAFLYGGRSFVVLPPGVAEYEVKQGNPETQVGFVAQYEIANGLGFTFSGNYFSSTYSGRLRLVELPDAEVFNFGLFWQRRAWQLKYDVLNLLDERYFRARTGDTLGDPLASAMPGRRWQLTLRARF